MNRQMHNPKLICPVNFFKVRGIISPLPFLLRRYTILIAMCLQKLMNSHHWVFKILAKNQRVMDGGTHKQMDGQRENSIPHHKVCRGGIINDIESKLNKSAFQDKFLLTILRWRKTMVARKYPVIPPILKGLE